MIHIDNPVKKIFVWALLLSVPIPSDTAFAESSIDDLALFGLSVDYSERRGYRDFGSGREDELDLSNLCAIGVTFGKRWHLSRRLRLQVKFDVQYGSSHGDTLPPIPLIDNTGTATIASTLLKTSLLCGGCSGEIHCPVKISPDGQWFFIAGAGVHAARVRETETLLEDNKIRIDGDPYVEDDHVALSASVNAGVGFEIIVSPIFGVAASYSLRYWYPVRYGQTRDLFPDHPIDYSERFLSHEISVVVLARR
jgi:hypothetical protein